MCCLHPASLHHQLGLVRLPVKKPLQNIAYMQGLGRVADVIRAWVMLQRGLVCIIETSFQKASQPMTLLFRRYRRDIRKAHVRSIFAHFGAKCCRACRRCWVLALQTAQIPSKTAMLSIGLLFCPFCFCCGWLVCCAVLAFSPLVFGPSGAPQPPNAAICGVLLRLRFRAGFGLFFWAARSGASGARARPHVNLLGGQHA